MDAQVRKIGFRGSISSPPARPSFSPAWLCHNSPMPNHDPPACRADPPTWFGAGPRPAPCSTGRRPAATGRSSGFGLLSAPQRMRRGVWPAHAGGPDLQIFFARRCRRWPCWSLHCPGASPGAAGRRARRGGVSPLAAPFLLNRRLRRAAPTPPSALEWQIKLQRAFVRSVSASHLGASAGTCWPNPASRCRTCRLRRTRVKKKTRALVPLLPPAGPSPKACVPPDRSGVVCSALTLVTGAWCFVRKPS